MVLTGGEDGIVRAWMPTETESGGGLAVEQDKAANRVREKKKVKDEKRFRPY